MHGAGVCHRGAEASVSLSLENRSSILFHSPSARGRSSRSSARPGCGKTTLLNLIAGIYRPESGDLQVRTSRISFVFQNDALLSWRTTLGNVLLPFELAGTRIDDELRARALKVLDDLGLAGMRGLLPLPALRGHEEARGACPGPGDRARAAHPGRAVLLPGHHHPGEAEHPPARLAPPNAVHGGHGDALGGGGVLPLRPDRRLLLPAGAGHRRAATWARTGTSRRTSTSCPRGA